MSSKLENKDLPSNDAKPMLSAVVSDMEIETMAVRLYKGKDIKEQRANLDKMIAFEKGAKWMLDKILNNSR